MTAGSEKLLLRRDLRFTLQSDGSSPLFVIEDPVRQKFFRVGRPEYLFLTHLDGRISVEEAVTRTNRQLREGLLTAANIPAIIGWLNANQLLSGGDDAQLKALQDRAERERLQKSVNRFNLISIKIPLFNPDRLLRRLFPLCRWLTGRMFFGLWLAVVAAAMLALAANWRQFAGQATTALAPGNLFFLWLAWLLLKIWHELFHALVCYRYGGRVHEAGILFILFIPLTYVNATSSWGFVSRWQRIHTAAAGMYAELFIAALATLLWAGSMHSITGAMAHNLVIVAGFSSLLFNANPLMRFDGYFILSDLLDIANLYDRGRQFANGLFSRLFFGESSYTPAYSGLREAFLRVYGLAAWFWRILVTVSLILLASQMFHGLGLIIAYLSAILLLFVPLRQLARKLREVRIAAPRQFRYFCMSAPLVTAIAFCGLLLISWSEQVAVPAVVEYRNPVAVKSASSGFVQSVAIRSGMQVAKGDLLVRLDNPELRSQLQQARLQIAALETESRLRLRSEDIPAYQSLRERTTALQEQEAALAQEVRQLEIRAGDAGTVVAEQLDELPGHYLHKGADICLLVDEEKKTLHASAAQDDIEGFRGREGQAVLVDFPLGGHDPFFGTIATVAPQASRLIEQPAFATTAGGPVAVRAAAFSAQENEQAGSPGYEFFQPRFKVDIEIPQGRAVDLRAGQQAVVETGGRRLTPFFLLRQHLLEMVARAAASTR